VPKDGVLVLDSLEAWAPRGDKQALDVLRQLRGHPARVKLVVAATNARGSVAGAGEIERAGDATVFVERNQIRVGKCRWAVGTTWTRHGASGLDVRRAGEGDDEVSPPTQPSPSQAEQLQPDFSEEAIRAAAGWSIRETEAYRARLRAGGVPNRAVDAERVVDEATDERADAAPTPRVTFTGSAGPAYAALAAAWSWREAVRASSIAQALAAPGFEQLGAALRALLGASEGAPLSATDVGNALKIARGVSCAGAVLTRQLDRKGIALWHLARGNEHARD
jgi:hypothetical protein